MTTDSMDHSVRVVLTDLALLIGTDMGSGLGNTIQSEMQLRVSRPALARIEAAISLTLKSDVDRQVNWIIREQLDGTIRANLTGEMTANLINEGKPSRMFHGLRNLDDSLMDELEKNTKRRQQ